MDGNKINDDTKTLYKHKHTKLIFPYTFTGVEELEGRDNLKCHRSDIVGYGFIRV